KEKQSLTSIVSACLAGLDQIHHSVNGIDGTIVQGDTTTCMAAGLFSFYNKVPVFHVEAGLRSHNIHSPYPEEFNRKVLGLFADIHFAPTQESAQNLLKEGISAEKVITTGNTSIDTLLLSQSSGFQKSTDLPQEVSQFIEDQKTKTILVTMHRRESFGAPMKNVFNAILDCLNSRQDIKFLFFAHLNPSVQEAIHEVFQEKYPRLLIFPPQDYFGFIKCLKSCYFILTDSGGLQEEGPALGKPVLVARENTERPEAVNAGSSLLVGTNQSKIIQSVNLLMDNTSIYNKMATAKNPFGDGTATVQILEAVKKFYFSNKQ
ncbi:MAG: non-hydrolyzing UDP-N-acetylglucosamine 2-epimerase, partial [Bdellovibrionales bacterium]